MIEIAVREGVRRSLGEKLLHAILEAPTVPQTGQRIGPRLRLGLLERAEDRDALRRPPGGDFEAANFVFGRRFVVEARRVYDPDGLAGEADRDARRRELVRRKPP